MKITETYEEMPHSVLGITAEAAGLLSAASADHPVLVIDLQGKHIGAAKSAFSRAGKAKGKRVDFQHDDNGLLYVRVLNRSAKHANV